MFRKPFTATYQFEKLQPARLLVYDVDVKAGDPAALRLEQQDFLGGWVGREGCLWVQGNVGPLGWQAREVRLNRAGVPAPAGACSPPGMPWPWPFALQSL